MKYLLAVIITSFLCGAAWAQTSYYAAAKSGLSIREQPDVNAKVLDKIPYGQKVEILKDAAEMKAISVEGFSGYWWLVKYNDKKGYVVSSYVLGSVPPGASVKKLEDYFAQISSPNGPPIVLQEPASQDEESARLKKQMYKNGMEWHETQGYEYGASLYILPGYTIEQAFLLVRLIGQYPDLINAKDVFPVKNNKIKNEIGEKIIELERETFDDSKQGPIKKIRIIHTQGAITEFEIFSIDSQVLISYSSGV